MQEYCHLPRQNYSFLSPLCCVEFAVDVRRIELSLRTPLGDVQKKLWSEREPMWLSFRLGSFIALCRVSNFQNLLRRLQEMRWQEYNPARTSYPITFFWQLITPYIMGYAYLCRGVPSRVSTKERMLFPSPFKNGANPSSTTICRLNQ